MLSHVVMFQLLSTPLQCSIRLVQPLCPAFPDALRLRFYPFYLHELVGRKCRASTFHISDKYCGVRLILSAGWATSPYKLR